MTPETEALIARVRELVLQKGATAHAQIVQLSVISCIADLAPQLATALEAAEMRADAAEAKLKVARALILNLVERREDQAGFYYVTKHMGGLGSDLSHQIESTLTQLEP